MKVPEVAANMALRHTAMMGLGTITNKMYWAHWKMAAPQAAIRPVVQQVIKVGLSRWIAQLQRRECVGKDKHWSITGTEHGSLYLNLPKLCFISFFTSLNIRSMITNNCS